MVYNKYLARLSDNSLDVFFISFTMAVNNLRDSYYLSWREAHDFNKATRKLAMLLDNNVHDL